jgi:hypothetical protein
MGKKFILKNECTFKDFWGSVGALVKFLNILTGIGVKSLILLKRQDLIDEFPE